MTDAAHDSLARLQRVQDPPIDEWPVFPTGHTTSWYNAVEKVTGDRPEPGSDIDAICRDRVFPDDPLFDSDRSYPENVARVQQHKNGQR
ncbi:hypothetical protein [Halosolutus gelatinilyticus]|uniref:hypothetical protein n=1 Tax=Halosolutus gelatinilyticus TaxID=2931975 RepID=UPI001FF12F4F|nr:hypothetical protein [Halosolutus gelatinilyticus]